MEDYEYGGLLCLVDHYGIDIAHNVLSSELMFVENKDKIITDLLVYAIDKLDEPLDDKTKTYINNVEKIEVAPSFLSKFTPLLDEYGENILYGYILQTFFVNNIQIRAFSLLVPNFYKIIKKLADVLLIKIIEHKHVEELIYKLPLDNISNIEDLNNILDKEYFLFNNIQEEDLPFF